MDWSEPDWGASAGNAWVAIQDLTDSVYAPVEQLLTGYNEVGSGDSDTDWVSIASSAHTPPRRCVPEQKANQSNKLA